MNVTTNNVTPVLLLVIAVAIGCATPQGHVKDLETQKLETKGRSSDGVIGLNEKRQLIIKSEITVENELRSQEFINVRLQDEVNREAYELKTCREDLADPRLGGDGKVAPLPEVDDVRTPTAVREELGMDADGEVKIVREQSFDEKFKNERKYEKTLRSMLKVVKENREQCQRTMRIARTKHGLPPERFGGDGYFVNGTWVQTQKVEHNLSDAFEISAQEKAKVTANQEQLSH